MCKRIAIAVAALCSILMLASCGAALHFKPAHSRVWGRADRAPQSPFVIPQNKVRLISSGTHSLAQNSQIVLTFNLPLASDSKVRLIPSASGVWRVAQKKLIFTPRYGLDPHTNYHIKLSQVITASGQRVPTETLDYQSREVDVLLLQRYLAQLNYLPVIYLPQTGKFVWRFPHEPPGLKAAWHTGDFTPATRGAVMSFESGQSQSPDGDAGPQVWNALVHALERHSKDILPYDYLLATQGPSDETLKVWRQGKTILTTSMNSGVKGAYTQDGTFPVYDKYQQGVMSGHNLDGSVYHDVVHWASFFNGGDAVHQFPRDSYGYPQSLGCIEIAASIAKKVWHMDPYGTLVTVEGRI